MDPINNPYTPNAGSRPQALAGRDQELEQFRVLVGRLKRGATAHLGTIKVVGPEGIELSVDLRTADEGTIARDLSELLLQLGRAAADKGTGVAFLLDEVQFVKEVEYRSVFTALHRATQKCVPLTLAA